MACRVGMTTDSEGRRSQHESDFNNLRKWTILHDGLSRDEAQSMETAEAQSRGCDSHPGGDDPDDSNATWSVYYFEHDGKK